MKLPFDTREMKAADAVKAVERLKSGIAVFEALIGLEKSHLKGERKSVLAILFAKLAEAEAKAQEKAEELLATVEAQEKAEAPDSRMSHRVLAALKERAAETVEVEDEVGVESALGDVLSNFSAEDLAKFGLCRMMGPDPDDPMAPEGVDEGAEEVTLDNCGRLDPDEWVADWDGKEWHLRRRSVQAQMRDKGQPPKAVLALLDEQSLTSADAPGSEPELPNVVLVTDVDGQIHEAVVVRAVLASEQPIVVCIKDGTDETLMVKYDGDARTRMSWRPRP